MAGWLAGWLADEMWVNFEILKFSINQFFKLFAMFNKVTALLEQCEWHFQQKMAVRSVKFRSHSFPC